MSEVCIGTHTAPLALCRNVSLRLLSPAIAYVMTVCSKPSRYRKQPSLRISMDQVPYLIDRANKIEISRVSAWSARSASPRRPAEMWPS